MRITRFITGVVLTAIGGAAAWAAYRLYEGCVIAPKLPGASTTVHVRVYVGKFALSDVHLVIALGLVAVICLGAGVWRLSEKD